MGIQPFACNIFKDSFHASYPNFDRHPFSYFFPGICRVSTHRHFKNLSTILASNILSMKDQLEGVPVIPNPAMRGYEKIAKVLNFIEKIREVLNKEVTGFYLCLMRAEKDPIDCHRGLLVSRALFDMGSEVYHIHFDGCIESHSQMEARLVHLYFPPNQVRLFDEPYYEKKCFAYQKYANRNAKSLEEEGEE